MRTLIVIMALALASCIGEDGGKGSFGNVQAGDRVPAFSTGGFVSPGGFIGKKSLLVFFNTGCPDCQRELPRIDEICRRHPEIQSIAIARDQTIGQWEYVMPTYADAGRAIYNLFAENTIPRVYLVNGLGTVVWVGVEVLPEDFEQLIINKLDL